MQKITDILGGIINSLLDLSKKAYDEGWFIYLIAGFILFFIFVVFFN